jgi:hypothetical protein
MTKKENIYLPVPGQGKVLADGTWWTNSSASVGEVCRSWQVCECVEVGMFGGRPFARWRRIS